MKFLNFFISFGLFTTVANAQITITNNDMPSVNDTFRLSSTNNIQGLDPVLTGANYSWNFSTLVPTSQRVDTFFAVSSTPIAYQFFFNNIILYPNHKASYALRGIDLGIPQVPITEVFNYIKNSSSAYDNVGFGSKINSVPSSTQNNPVDREYTFPMNYNGNHTSNSVYGMSVPTFGYYGQSMERIDTVDGWGTLALPNGNYTVLRVKSILHKIDTTYLDLLGFGTTIPRPEEIEYKWLAAGMGMPVLKIITNAGNVTRIEYQDINMNVSVAEINNKITQVTIFPNPAKNLITIDFNATVAGYLTVILKDILGNNVATLYTNNLTGGKNKLVIDLAKYTIQSGIYFLEINVDNRQHSLQKLVIAE